VTAKLADAPPCRLETSKELHTLLLSGDWSLPGLTDLTTALRRLELARSVGVPTCIDGAALSKIDTAAALLLWRQLQAQGIDAATVRLEHFAPNHLRVMQAVRQRLPDTQVLSAPHRLRALASFGMAALALGRLLQAHIAFFGITASALLHLMRQPRALRVKELFAQLRQAGVTAIPVVSLVMFLIGLVVAYLLGLQAEQYGANIFVVDGVALGMVREFSPLLVATIVAGRSGAAFTAQLGTMKLTEEIDAIRTLGLSAEQVLLLPRVLALVIMLPLLVFVGDLLGLAGAAAVCELMLDIPPAAFLERLHASLLPRHYLIGLGKAPVFAMFIAIIGCSMGLTVSRDTRSIGINTTSTVVQSIVAVIVLDAIFAVIFQRLDL
jgi:phospholipid/cholesterol/gamma-HCH transport system permease protein